VGKQGTIDLYSYPQGILEGQITGLSGPGGDCSDKKGNVYVTDVEPSGNEIVEFAHGGTQALRTLSVPSGSNPYSCAVDPTTGDLAVTNYGNTAGDGASLLIYLRQRASRNPTPTRNS
jgi:DNA-binding beta-propeller fold protein YncE